MFSLKQSAVKLLTARPRIGQRRVLAPPSLAMASRRAGKEARGRGELEALEAASLDDLKARFPEDWVTVGEGMVAAAQTGRPEAIAAFVTRAAKAGAPWRARLKAGAGGAELLANARRQVAMARMATLAARETLTAAAAQAAIGHAGERLRFGFFSGQIVQRLFFERGLERKPVSMAAFRWLWPLVRQRRILMPLVQPKGIYCFYSRELVLALEAEIGERSCLEIAAGDGTLARFLRAAGVDIRATDDRSWSQTITYPADVENLDAVTALARYQPRVVVCSFPPPKNAFEQQVFRAPSVELYVVVTTAHRFAAGDWDAYEKQTAFAMEASQALARLVLPPESDPLVLLFRRR